MRECGREGKERGRKKETCRETKRLAGGLDNVETMHGKWSTVCVCVCVCVCVYSIAVMHVPASLHCPIPTALGY